MVCGVVDCTYIEEPDGTASILLKALTLGLLFGVLSL